MKILYVLYFNPYSSENAGVKKKIDNQLDAIETLGKHVDLAYIRNSKLVIENRYGEKRTYDLYKGRTNYRKSMNLVLKKIVDKQDYTHLYFRFPGSIEWYFFNTLKSIKKQNIYIFLELPTYPFDGERRLFLKSEIKKKRYLSYFLRQVIYFSEKIYTLRIKKYVNKIVTFMSHKKIWGINTIVIENGVNVNEYLPALLSKSKEYEDIFVLTGVANISEWHGYDRVIEGIKNYKSSMSKKRNIIFNVVGNSVEAERLQELVNSYNLNDCVFFLGTLYNDDLKKVYEQTDLAIGSLGMHRIGLSEGSTLKVKEYCSLGIPFVISYVERGLPENFSYCLNVSSNDSAIEIQELVDFNSKFSDRKMVSEVMHEFAVVNFSWNKQMNRIFGGGKQAE